MRCLCVVLLLVGLTLADPTVFFMEKFETGMLHAHGFMRALL